MLIFYLATEMLKGHADPQGGISEPQGTWKPKSGFTFESNYFDPDSWGPILQQLFMVILSEWP